MKDTCTITREQLERVFESLTVVISLKDSYEKEADTLQHQKYLSEFCGYMSALYSLDLLHEWDEYRAEQYRKQLEMEAA